jgi:hypothetical protein
MERRRRDELGTIWEAPDELWAPLASVAAHGYVSRSSANIAELTAPMGGVIGVWFGSAQPGSACSAPFLTLDMQRCEAIVGRCQRGTRRATSDSHQTSATTTGSATGMLMSSAL